MEKAYVTILRSIDYLPGVLVLHHSLGKVASAAGLLVLTAPDLPEATLDLLAHLGMKTQPVEGICQADGRRPGLRQTSNYYKLAALSLTRYKKVVYLDADMLVCRNIDDLFEKEKWSAVNVRGWLSNLYNWIDFDSGLMVLEPCMEEFETLLRKARGLKTDEERYQSYLNLFHPQWYATKSLHLELNYNVYAAHLDHYCELPGYRLPGEPAPVGNDVKVIHFWGARKPWHATDAGHCPGRYRQAFEAWHDNFRELLMHLPQQRSHWFKPYLPAMN